MSECTWSDDEGTYHLGPFKMIDRKPLCVFCGRRPEYGAKFKRKEK